MKSYCHSCAIASGIVKPSIQSNLSGTSYQLDKFLKHTAPAAAYWGINSVFDDPSFESYKNYIVTTQASGTAQIDDRGRINMVWYAGSGIGAVHQGGEFKISATAVKLVLPNDDSKVHAFPIKLSRALESSKCELCGASIPI